MTWKRKLILSLKNSVKIPTYVDISFGAFSFFGRGIACRYCNWDIGNKYINEMAVHLTVPIMNLQCDLYHPMQDLAYLMIIQEVQRLLKILKFLLFVCMQKFIRNVLVYL